MIKFVMWYIKPLFQHYDEEHNDGAGKKVYEWFLKTYKPDSNGWDKELEWLENMGKVDKDDTLEDK